MKRFALVFALASFVAGSALAQEKSPTSAPTKKGYTERKAIIFEDEEIEGAVPNKDGIYIVVTQRKKPGSLIKIREDFNREMAKSVDEL